MVLSEETMNGFEKLNEETILSSVFVFYQCKTKESFEKVNCFATFSLYIIIHFPVREEPKCLPCRFCLPTDEASELMDGNEFPCLQTSRKLKQNI